MRTTCWCARRSGRGQGRIAWGASGRGPRLAWGSEQCVLRVGERWRSLVTLPTLGATPRRRWTPLRQWSWTWTPRRTRQWHRQARGACAAPERAVQQGAKQMGPAWRTGPRVCARSCCPALTAAALAAVRPALVRAQWFYENKPLQYTKYVKGPAYKRWKLPLPIMATLHRLASQVCPPPQTHTPACRANLQLHLPRPRPPSPLPSRPAPHCPRPAPPAAVGHGGPQLLLPLQRGRVCHRQVAQHVHPGWPQV